MLSTINAKCILLLDYAVSCCFSCCVILNCAQFFIFNSSLQNLLFRIPHVMRHNCSYKTKLALTRHRL